MARAIDLSDLSLDELCVLAGRVQSRIATLTTSTANIRQTSAREHTDPWASSGNASPDPSRPGLVSGNRSGTQTTLSERVQDLSTPMIPGKAREWGRPDGPYPSTEGMSFAPRKVRLACIVCSMDLLPCRFLGRHAQILVGRLPQPPLLVGNLPLCLPSFLQQ